MLLGDVVADGAAAENDIGTSVASSGCAQWWLGAVDLLTRNSPNQGDSVADYIKEQLMERDRSVCAQHQSKTHNQEHTRIHLL